MSAYAILLVATPYNFKVEKYAEPTIVKILQKPSLEHDSEYDFDGILEYYGEGIFRGCELLTPGGVFEIRCTVEFDTDGDGYLIIKKVESK
jgi:hypothetical protein